MEQGKIYGIMRKNLWQRQGIRSVFAMHQNKNREPNIHFERGQRACDIVSLNYVKEEYPEYEVWIKDFPRIYQDSWMESITK
jgi:hypothetical protein